MNNGHSFRIDLIQVEMLMSATKLAIVYYSSTGHNYQMARWAEEAALAAGAEVRLVKVRELAPDAAIDANPAWREHVNATKDVPIAGRADLEWADAIIWSAPTRFGVLASQMKQFIDEQGGLWAAGGTVNKVVSAMSSAQNMHGGQEATLLSFYTIMMHWAAIIVPPGFSDPVIFKSGGNPYGASATADGKGLTDALKASVQYQARRTLEVAAKLKA